MDYVEWQVKSCSGAKENRREADGFVEGGRRERMITTVWNLKDSDDN